MKALSRGARDGLAALLLRMQVLRVAVVESFGRRLRCQLADCLLGAALERVQALLLVLSQVRHDHHFLALLAALALLEVRCRVRLCLPDPILRSLVNLCYQSLPVVRLVAAWTFR